MNEIADFLRARIAERRALAEAATPGPWTTDASIPYGNRVGSSDDSDWIAWTGEHGEDGSEADARHIAANNPEAVIADCDAKLALIDHMVGMLAAAEGDTEVDHYGALGAAEQTLCLLAQPFAGHPDHKGEGWAP